MRKPVAGPCEAGRWSGQYHSYTVAVSRMSNVHKVGPYEVLDQLKSGQRPVYRARAAGGSIVALKIVSAAEITPEARERFLREGQICAALDHPNLVHVHEFGEADGFLYMAMDVLEGLDLS